MKNALKGALLSGLFFPGLGQFWLRRRIWGAVLLLGTFAALTAICVKMTERAYQLLARAEAEGGQVDLFAVAKGAQAAGYADPSIRVAGLALVVLWVVGVLHAYWEGRKLDREGQRVQRSEGGGR